MTMVYPEQILILTHSEVEAENDIIKIDNWYVAHCVPIEMGSVCFFSF
jgi:hypothetical protein